MKIRFLGSYGTKISGCNCRGGSHERRTLISRKTYGLPSGRVLNCVKGKVEEVSEADGLFLLANEYTDKNGTHKEFERVKDEH